MENKTYKPLVLILFLTVATLSFASIDNSSAASILYVNGSSGNDSYDGESPIFTSGINGPKSTIQNATNTIDTNGTINVANGIYKEHLIISKSVNLIGESQIGTIIDGEHTGRVININDSLKINISNFTLQNGYVCEFEISLGGAIYNQGNLTIKNTNIQNNRAGEGGGAIYNQGNLTIKNSIIQNGTAYEGGGIFNRGILTIQKTTIQDNTGGEFSGGISNYNKATITDSIIQNNYAFYEAGGILNFFGTITIINTTIQNNTAGVGGGIDNYGIAIIKNSKLQNNKGTCGGAIYNGGGITIINTTIQNNKAKYGAGIYSDFKTTIINTTIQNNTAQYGGAIYNELKLIITSSKIQNNKAKYGGAIYNKGTKSTISIKKSTIRKNTATKYGGAIYSTSGKIVANYNRITSNTHYAIYRKGGTINAKYNWWGSKKPKFYKIIKGKVTYRPWLKK